MKVFDLCSEELPKLLGWNYSQPSDSCAIHHGDKHDQAQPNEPLWNILVFNIMEMCLSSGENWVEQKKFEMLTFKQITNETYSGMSRGF